MQFRRILLRNIGGFTVGCLVTSLLYQNPQVDFLQCRPSSSTNNCGSALREYAAPDELEELARRYTPTKFFPHLHTGYHRIYKLFLQHLRQQPIRLLEIGIDSGNGTLLWKQYFPRAEIYGIEKASDTVGVRKGNAVAKIFQGDQANATFLQEVIQLSGGNFDVIIDDGGHSFKQQLTSYSVLFEKGLKLGGLYFIEDIETSYYNGKCKVYGETISGGVKSQHTPVSLFQRMVHVVNRKFHDNQFKVFGAVDWWIKGISFFQNVIILQKKDFSDRAYDAHYLWPNCLRTPAELQGDERSYGPSPFKHDAKDPLWRAIRGVTRFSNRMNKSGRPVYIW